MEDNSRSVVAAVHGNGVFSDSDQPDNIGHQSNGALVSPVTSPGALPVVGKIHFILPMLPALPATNSSSGFLTTELYVDLSPTGEALRDLSQVTLVEIFAGKDLIWKSEEPLCKSKTFEVLVDSPLQKNSDVYNENKNGLGVTMTIAFYGRDPPLLFSSVALIQTIRRSGGGVP